MSELYKRMLYGQRSCQYKTKKENRSLEFGRFGWFFSLMPISDSNEVPDQSIIERADRLKEAVKRAGGPAGVARQIGMSLPTLNNYLAGRDMKASAAASLADACGVTGDWLLFGRGPMTYIEDEQRVPVFFMPGFENLLPEKANFCALITLIRTCQEWHDGVRITPTLSDVFKWILPLYVTARTLPDLKLEIRVLESGQ